MKLIVTKFGGSSLADAEQFAKVGNILKSNKARKVAVASAPGKRNSGDVKVTDMLYRCCSDAEEGRSFDESLNLIRERYAEIMQDLSIEFELDSEINAIREHLLAGPDREFMASRGEYLNAKLLARYLDWTFLDAADYVRFNEDGTLDDETTDELLRGVLSEKEYVVLPGFYGADASGRVHTFSRGGSDISGSLAARAINAEVYENWTDVSGMLMTDPRIVDNPGTIDYISYQELRELSYMGASVLHEDAVFPVRKAGIPINIRNTNRPQDKGTMIVAELPKNRRPKIITGIAGSRGFSCIHVEKPMMNMEVGFGARLLKILADHGISFEHCPTGFDTMSVFVESACIGEDFDDVLDEIRQELDPEILIVDDSFAILAIVGHGMAYSKGVSARIFGALAEANVNIRMIDQGSSGLNIIVGVDEEDYEAAVQACYRVGKEMN